jgi:hypothetical protein
VFNHIQSDTHIPRARWAAVVTMGDAGVSNPEIVRQLKLDVSKESVRVFLNSDAAQAVRDELLADSVTPSPRASSKAGATQPQPGAPQPVIGEPVPEGFRPVRVERDERGKLKTVYEPESDLIEVESAQVRECARIWAMLNRCQNDAQRSALLDAIGAGRSIYSDAELTRFLATIPDAQPGPQEPATQAQPGVAMSTCALPGASQEDDDARQRKIASNPLGGTVRQPEPVATPEPSPAINPADSPRSPALGIPMATANYVLTPVVWNTSKDSGIRDGQCTSCGAEPVVIDSMAGTNTCGNCGRVTRRNRKTGAWETMTPDKPGASNQEIQL